MAAEVDRSYRTQLPLRAISLQHDPFGIHSSYAPRIRLMQIQLLYHSRAGWRQICPSSVHEPSDG